LELTKKILNELQKRLKIGNRRSIHLNAIPAKSRYKFDVTRLAYIDKDLPNDFIQSLLSDNPLKFRISWKDNVVDINSLFEDDQLQLVKITKSFENLINQTETIELEKGINTFGFGFPLLIRRDQADNKLTVAPVLIWSLRIKRTKDFNTWEINRNEDDPIYLNEVLINHLQNDSKIEIEPIPNEMLDDGLISKSELIEICVNLIKTINSSVPIDIFDTFKKKLDNITPICEKAHYEKLPLNSTNSLIDFCGLFSIFEVQKQNIINDYDNLMELEGLTIDLNDMDGDSFQSISSVETDPSQQNILHSLESIRNILIQGPPGTGKSQTLTAILVNALENQKKTIVVCEKRTALEVLHNALIDKGLNDNCVLIRDIVKDRKTVVESVRNRVDNTSYRRYRYPCSKELLSNLIKKAQLSINSINSKHKKLDEKLLGDYSWTYVVGKLLAELNCLEKDAPIDLDKNIFSFSLQEFNEMLDIVQAGQKLYQDYKPLEKVSFINIDKLLIGENPFLIEQEINASFNTYFIELKKIIELEQQYKKEYINIRNSELNSQLAQGNEILMQIRGVLETNKVFPDFLNEKKTGSIIYKTLSVFSKRRKKIINDQNNLRTLLVKIKTHFSSNKDLFHIEFSNSIQTNLIILDDVEKAINEIISLFGNKIEIEYSGLNLLDLSEQKYQTKYLDILKEEVDKLNESIIKDKWTVKNIRLSNFKKFISDINEIIQDKENFFTNENDPLIIEFKWVNFYYKLNEGVKKLIDELIGKSDWRKSFLIYYLNTLLVNSANNDLPTNNNEYDDLDGTLSEIGKEQLKYIRQLWFSEQIDATRRFEQNNNNLSVENLYNKRSSYRFKRLSLRQIVQYDADLFTTFFPIILTSPDVCCNLFNGMNKYFDIVLFDEASQLRLEDNLPAILKGKQVIISGDEHQMPPSNYFSKVFDGSIEDEDDLDEEDEVIIDKDNLILSCESLLEFGTELNFEKKHLDFHYRSRHPYLIDFSNHAFYNQRLKPIPNDFEYIPFKYIQVNGTFSEYTNDAEAEAVLSILEYNINRLPSGEYPSIGIATFNIAQRNLIKSKILERQKFSKFEAFNDKMKELEDNGMFVKNLENIQGDEKDVIILSTTYGIGKEGKFAQRFGPINHSKGYKLLNVIITRAKYKVYVCTSVPENVFMDYRDFLITEGANNKRAVFYAYLAYAKAISEGDNSARLAVLSALDENSTMTTTYDRLMGGELESPFEEEVYQALKDKFGEQKLIPQFQFAGFRIDIVYDSKAVGVPKIAIECDGAKYHSSREAYLYDSHRQKILENHGFVFHRIWSTNWWRNPKRETDKLIDFIQSTDLKANLKLNDFSKTALAFTDEVLDVKKSVSHVSFVDHEKEFNKVQTIDEPKIEITKPLKPEIKENSIVLVKYVNNGKNFTVQLVDSTHDKYESTSGIQQIFYKSPLAASIIGHSVGDIVKIGNLDNYVEIVEINN
jgi:superfamily I DNA and/or RNA helicase/very-short-patch-repair endonuclease